MNKETVIKSNEDGGGCPLRTGGTGMVHGSWFFDERSDRVERMVNGSRL